jgi:hypothetical protein
MKYHDEANMNMFLKMAKGSFNEASDLREYFPAEQKMCITQIVIGLDVLTNVLQRIIDELSAS